MPSKNPSANFASVTENSEFLSLFRHRWDFLRAPTPQPGEAPQWTTETRYPLSDRVFQAGGFLYGVRFGKETNYFLIDLDRDSPYHPARDEYAVGRIAEALEVLGVTDYLAVTSSYSQGVHLYYPLSKPVESWKLGLAVTGVLERAGFAIRAGQLEVFPNRRLSSSGKPPALFAGHRLPLQAGSYLLNRSWEPAYPSEERFAEVWRNCAARNSVPVEQLNYWAKQAIPARRLSRRATEFLADLNSEIETGWTGFHQTNRLLGRIALREYVFGGYLEGQPALTGDRLTAKIAFVAVNLPGYQEFCRHQHEIWQRAEEWARCVENSRYFPYRGKKPLVQAAEQSPSWQELAASASRERIRSAIATLLEQERLPIGATDRFRVLTREFGIGGGTLYRNRDLWHPQAVEPPPTPPQQDLVCDETPGAGHSGSSGNPALGLDFSDLVHEKSETSGNPALGLSFHDSS